MARVVGRVSALRDHATIEVLQMLAISAFATIVVALPVLLSPHERIFGGEIVGRHHDPLTVIQQFAQGGVRSLYRQPLTDDVGAWLSQVFGPVAAYNVVVLATFPLAALGAYALARYLRLPHRGSLVAGLIFAFAPVHVAQAAYHPHIAQVQWIPIYFLALFVAVDRPTLTSAALLAATAGCLTFSNFYGGLIGAAVTPVALAAYWTASPRGPRTARGLILPLTTLIGLLGLGLVAVRAAAPEVFRNPEALAFPLSDLDRYGARWWAYFVPPVDNALLGQIAAAVWRREDIGPGLLEQQVSLGWGVLGLTGVLLWVVVTRACDSTSRRTAAVLAAIGLWASLLSLAPASSGFLNLSAILHQGLPMFRAYARFGIVTSLTVAIATGMAVEYLWRRPGRVGDRRPLVRRAWAVALLGLTIIELSPLPWRARDVLPTQGHRWLAGLGTTALVLDCRGPNLGDSGVPWLMQNRLVFMTPPFDGCGDPGLSEKLPALGYTHVLARGGQTVGNFDGLVLSRRFQDSRVYAVNRPPPEVITLGMEGFFAWEQARGQRWRWMSQQGWWTVRNTTPAKLRAALEIELEAFARPRTLVATLGSTEVAVLHVVPGRRRYALGTVEMSPGDHALSFRAIEPADRPGDLTGNGDMRPVTVMFTSWSWSVG